MKLDFLDKSGNLLVALFHKIALFAIGMGTVWSAAHTFMQIFDPAHASITVLLMLFIYLEIGAMVSIYFKTNHMPVRFLIYIAITALTHRMVDIMTHAAIDATEVITLGATIFILAISVVVVKYGSTKFPSEIKSEEIK
jgi:phosphate starvation-inducible membrane PsiE